MYLRNRVRCLPGFLFPCGGIYSAYSLHGSSSDVIDIKVAISNLAKKLQLNNKLLIELSILSYRSAERKLVMLNILWFDFNFKCFPPR